MALSIFLWQLKSVLCVCADVVVVYFSMHLKTSWFLLISRIEWNGMIYHTKWSILVQKTAALLMPDFGAKNTAKHL